MNRKASSIRRTDLSYQILERGRWSQITPTAVGSGVFLYTYIMMMTMKMKMTMIMTTMITMIITNTITIIVSCHLLSKGRLPWIAAHVCRVRPVIHTSCSYTTNTVNKTHRRRRLDNLHCSRPQFLNCHIDEKSMHQSYESQLHKSLDNVWHKYIVHLRHR